MQYNVVRTAKETRENNNGGVVEIQYNRDGRQGQRRRQSRTSMMAEVQDNRDGYGGGGDVGRQQMRCETKYIGKLVKGRRRTGKISTGNNYQSESVSSLWDNVDGRQGQR